MIEPLVSAAATIAVAGGFLIVSQALAWRLGARATLTRWLAVVSVIAWLATMLFHVLIAVGAFARGPALGALALLAGAVLLTGGPGRRTMPWRRRDRVFVRRIVRLLRRRRSSLIIAAFFVGALPPLLHALILPPLGWDTLTYHSLKSAMWVQRGTLAGMSGPGPWAYYRYMPAGSEALTAWAMLPSSSDAFTPLLEIGQWLAIGLAMMMLAREIGVREPFASTAAGFVMAIPTVRLLLGSGYVELCLLFTLVAGLALGLAGRRRPGLLIVAAGALGVSAATKTTMIAVTGLPLLILLSDAVYRGGRLARATVTAAGIAYATAVLPWLVAATIHTGAPLSPVPLTLGPLVLGQAPPEVSWYLDREIVSGFIPELSRLQWLLTPPAQHTEALGLLLAVPLAGMMVGWVSLLRQRRFSAVLLASAALTACALYLSPEFAVIRQYWTENSSRFLLPAAAIVVVVSVAWCDRRSRIARGFAVLLGAGGLWNLGTFALVGFSDLSRQAVAVVGVAMILGVAVWLGSRRLPQIPLRVAATLALLAFAGASLQLYRDQLRTALRQTDFTLHGFASWNYWNAAATLVDDLDRPARIAVTSGPFQNIDNWFAYPFMGRRLQNEIVYVPISGDGRLRHFGGHGENEELFVTANSWVWTARLRQQRVNYVVSFRPRSIELAWMQADPATFERIDGDGESWGLFRLR